MIGPYCPISLGWVALYRPFQCTPPTIQFPFFDLVRVRGGSQPSVGMHLKHSFILLPIERIPD
jgi:hypothetical protein